MHKVYLLLRNNKQQGPYTLDELLLQSLKPMDLVWVEGKSVGWKYPTEIDALKTYVAAAGEEVKVEKEVTVIHESLEAKIPLPGKKINRTKRIYVSLPGGVMNSEPAVTEESFSRKLEKKAEELYQRAQAYEENRKREEAKVKVKDAMHEESEVNTKYSRSLDDIKEEYSAWLYDQKKNKKTPRKKFNLTVAFTLFILVAGFTASRFVFKKNNTPLVTEQKLALEEMTEPVETMQIPVIKTAERKTAAKTSKKTSSKKILPATKKTTAKKKTGNPFVVKETKTAPVAEKNSIFLPDLVKVTGIYAANKKGIPDFKITVQNNSDERLRYVTVDVYYYKSDGNLADTKTIYFNKIPAHQNITLTAPGDSKADDIIFRMGLISSEKGELYYTK